ncbi:MAG: DUF4231 domain-containing protein [Phototrophicaceae bacterium]
MAPTPTVTPEETNFVDTAVIESDDWDNSGVIVSAKISVESLNETVAKSTSESKIVQPVQEPSAPLQAQASAKPKTPPPTKAKVATTAKVESLPTLAEYPADKGKMPYISPNASLQVKIKHYFETRWLIQWEFYDREATRNKRLYQTYQRFIQIGSVTVPILIGLSFVSSWIPAIISVMVAAAASIEQVMSYGDNWRTYRSTAERLMRERVLFEANSGSYNKSKTPFRVFVQRCEDIIAEETGRYQERQQEDTTGGDSGASGGEGASSAE